MSIAPADRSMPLVNASIEDGASPAVHHTGRRTQTTVLPEVHREMENREWGMRALKTWGTSRSHYNYSLAAPPSGKMGDEFEALPTSCKQCLVSFWAASTSDALHNRKTTLTGQQQVIQDESGQWSGIYGASEARNLEPEL